MTIDACRKLDRGVFRKKMDLAVKGKNRAGRATFTGNRENLKRSQAYNRSFGREAVQS